MGDGFDGPEFNKAKDDSGSSVIPFPQESKPKPKHGDMLLRAHELLTVDRESERGDPRPVYEVAAVICQVLGYPLRAADIALVMVAVKLARERAGGHHPDNATDAAAYLDIYEYLHPPPDNKPLSG